MPDVRPERFAFGPDLSSTAHDLLFGAPAGESYGNYEIVVLTGASTLRLETGLSLLQAGKGERLLVSGVNPQATRDDIQGDVFLPPEEAQKAMHGDRVVVRIARIEAGGRADGHIVKVLKRAHQTVVGEFHIRRRGNFVAPQDERIREWIEIPEGMEIPPGGKPIDRVGVTPLVISNVVEMDSRAKSISDIVDRRGNYRQPLVVF